MMGTLKGEQRERVMRARRSNIPLIKVPEGGQRMEQRKWDTTDMGENFPE